MRLFYFQYHSIFLEGKVMGLLLMCFHHANSPTCCMHAGDDKDAGGEIVEIRDEVPELWLLEGTKHVYFTQPDTAGLPRGDLTKCAAHWSVPCTQLFAPVKKQMQRGLRFWVTHAGHGHRWNC